MNRRTDAAQDPAEGDPARRGDDDLAALFDAQGEAVSIPADLDTDIRAAARAESTRANDPVPAVGVRRTPPRWLAAAAVVVLALVLVPLVRQAPESREGMSTDGVSTDASSRPSVAADTSAATYAGESPAATGPSAMGDVAESESAAVTESRPATAADAPAPDRSARRSSAIESLSAAAGTRSAGLRAADPFAGYRQDPSAWLDRLRERLRTDGLTRELQAEYRRFRSRHPEVEPAFDPAAVAREGDATRR